MQGSEVRDLAQPAEFGDTQISWSIRWFPDSTRLLAVSHLWNGRRTTWQASIVDGALRKLREDTEAWSVSPDGALIAATSADGHELWVMDADGGNPRKLFTVGDLSRLRSVQWSPDTAQLLYLKSDDLGARKSIEICDFKSGARHLVLSDPQLRDLHWLRDGRALYVLTEPALKGETCNYWIGRIDQRTGKFASKPRQLTHNNGFCVVDTSATADTKKLVFSKEQDESSVQVADIDAGGMRITPPMHFSLIEGIEWPNGWTADSREVVFTSNRNGNWGIYRQPLTGGTARPILVEHTPQPEFGFPRPSPDGAWLFIEHTSPGSVPGTHADLLRVPMAGGPPQLIARDIYHTPRCAAAPIRLCAYATREKDQLIFRTLDPELGPGRELGRFTMSPKGFYEWSLSPDGTRIAIQQVTTGNIRILNLKTKALEDITVQHWNNLLSMDWAADGKGFFMSSIQPSCVLLHVDLRGNAQVLWRPLGVHMIWAIPSPDGRHLAMLLHASSTNVWMMENF